MMNNFNHSHVHSGGSLSSGGVYETITAGDMRDALSAYPDDAELFFGRLSDGTKVLFAGFKNRGEKMLQILIADEHG